MKQTKIYTRRRAQRILTTVAALGIAVLWAGCEFVSERPRPSQAPDFIVSDVRTTVSESALTDLTPVTFQVTVSNVGGPDTTGAVVYFFVDGQFMGDAVLSALRAGESEVVEVEWDAVPGEHTFSFRVDETPLGESTIEESNETNNTEEIELNIPFAMRTLANQETTTIGDFLGEVEDTEQLNATIELAESMGLSADPDNVTLRAEYETEGDDEAGVVQYMSVLSGEDGEPDDSTFLFTTVVDTGDGGAAQYAYLFEIVDDNTVRLFDGTGSVVLNSDGTVEVVGPGGGKIAAALQCEEENFWQCVARFIPALRLSDILCVFSAITNNIGDPVGFIQDLAQCPAVFVPLVRCLRQSANQPPVIVTFATNELTHRCEVCDGDDLVVSLFKGYRALAFDDREPPAPTFETPTEFAPTACEPQSFTFRARDCDGAVSTRTVTTVRVIVERVVNHPACRHDQGGGGN